MKKALKLLIFTFFLPFISLAQDWFEDTRSDGISVFQSTQGGKKALFSGRFNTKDGIALNFFDWSKNQKFGLINPSNSSQTLWFSPIKQDSLKLAWGEKTFKDSVIKYPRLQVLPKAIQDSLKTAWGNHVFLQAITNSVKDQGWGIALKSKAEQGIGSLFSSGQFADGFAVNLYLAGQRSISAKEWGKVKNRPLKKGDSYRFWALVGGITNSQYRFYRPDLSNKDQLSDFESITGFQAGYSYFTITPNANEDNILRGISINYALKNNYKKLPKVEIKDYNDNTSIGSLRNVQLLDDNGSTYALETPDSKLSTFGVLTIRGQLGIIPKTLDNRISFLFYPELAYQKQKLTVNLGLGVQFLKKGNPLISEAGVFAKLTDVFNAGGSNNPFIQRTLELGLTASLNILTGVNQ
jgi:hypothetical protein